MPAQTSSFPPGLVIYQIYPRSFQDSNGDGIGDLAGIIHRLDYLVWLGVKAIWISPFYKSPMADFGYDVTDHQAIDPLFGDLATFDRLLSAAHEKGIQIIVDLVVNHTSDQHPWFQAATRSRQDPYHDWYVWRRSQNPNEPPNNWLSVFGGPAWAWNATTEEYYLHSFSEAQPDLNWANPQVRQAVKDIMLFWLKRGVDGFRLDAVYWYAKDPLFRDDPLNLHFLAGQDTIYDSLEHRYSRNQPELADYLRELGQVLEDHPGTFMVTEATVTPATNEREYLSLYHEMDARVSAPFNFTGLNIPWQAAAFRHFLNTFQAVLEAPDVPIYVLGNHDQPRLASRFGAKATRSVALLLLSLPGAAVMYYGDELGMANVIIPRGAVQDKVQTDGRGNLINRDIERTPMLWSAGEYAGFSTATPWLPLGNYQTMNVEAELKDPGSLLNLYHQLLTLRQQADVLKYGSYETLDMGHDDLLGFARSYNNERWATVINFSGNERIPYDLPGSSIVLSTERSHTPDKLLLPNEGRLLKLS